VIGPVPAGLGSRWWDERPVASHLARTRVRPVVASTLTARPANPGHFLAVSTVDINGRPPDPGRRIHDITMRTPEVSPVAPSTFAGPAERGSAAPGRGSDFAELMRQVRAAGLVQRRTGYCLASHSCGRSAASTASPTARPPCGAPTRRLSATSTTSASHRRPPRQADRRHRRQSPRSSRRTDAALERSNR